MTTLTTSNLYTATLSNLKSLISANVTDPITNSKTSSRKWIFEEEPDVKAFGTDSFGAYPIIIVRSPDLSDEAINLKRDFKDNTFNFEVEVRTKFKQVNSSNVPIINTISDELLYALRNSTDTTTLDGYKMWNLKVTSSKFNGMDEAQQRLSIRVFAIELNSQMNL